MMDFDAVQKFGDFLKRKYLDEISPALIEEMRADSVSLDRECLQIQCLKKIVVFECCNPDDDIIRSIMTVDKKSEMTAYMAGMLKENNDFNDDTISAFFVSCCYFGYLWDFFSPESTDSVIDALCTAISDEKLREYLSILGSGILNRGYHSEFSVEQIRKAIELYPENEMSAVFDFILCCAEYDELFIKLKDKDIKNDDEFNALMQRINQYIIDLSIKFKRIDMYYQELLLRPDISDENKALVRLDYSIYLPHINAKRIPTGFMESLMAYKNPMHCIGNERENKLEGVMPSHADYLHTDFDSSKALHDQIYAQKKDYAFFGVKLYLDVSRVTDFFRIYGNLLETHEQLKNSVDEKKSMISEFAHTYGNMSAETLGIIADTLLKNESAEIRTLGRRVMIECSIKQDLIKQIYLLRLKFKDNYDEVRRQIKDGFRCTPDKCTVTIKDITDDAAIRVMYRILYDRSHSAKLKKGQRNIRGLTGIDDLDAICDDFEKNVIQDGISVFEWLRQKDLKLDFTADGGFNDIYAVKGSQSELFIRDIITECFFNMIKYSDLTKPIYIGFTTDADYYRIIFRNTPSEYACNFDGEGLSSKKAMIEFLNEDSSEDTPRSDIKWSNQNDGFVTEVIISKQFLEG